MRFRKRVQIFPGFSLNFSGSGISSTIGFKGASINISKRGSYLNVGIPGTGIYDRIKLGQGEAQQKGVAENPTSFPNRQEDFHPKSTIVTSGEISSLDNTTISSSNFQELKETLLEAYSDKLELRKELELTNQELKTAKIIYIISCIFLFGFIIKTFKNSVTEKQEYIRDLEGQILNEFVDISFTFDGKYNSSYQKLRKAHEKLINTEFIWDITSSVAIDRVKTRSSASSSVSREIVKFGFGNIDIIKCDYEAFHWENKNGGDLYIYPAFVIVINSKRDFAIIDIKDLELSFGGINFNETEKIPSDTKVIGQTWTYVNKNGQPDRRFKDNFEIPVVEYAGYNLSTKSGLNEMYCLSNFNAAKDFAISMKDYQDAI